MPSKVNTQFYKSYYNYQIIFSSTAYTREKYPGVKEVEMNLVIGDTCVQSRRAVIKEVA